MSRTEIVARFGNKSAGVETFGNFRNCGQWREAATRFASALLDSSDSSDCSDRVSQPLASRPPDSPIDGSEPEATLAESETLHDSTFPFPAAAAPPDFFAAPPLRKT